MRKCIPALAIITGLLATVLVIPSATAIGDTGTNEVRITIGSWWFVSPSSEDTKNVSFRISFDANDDGLFEQVNDSAIFNNKSMLAGPFMAIMVVPDPVANVKFKVQAFDHNGTIAELDYGGAIVHTASNVDNATDAWSYNRYNGADAGPNTCVINYFYNVLPVPDPDPHADATTGGDAGGLNLGDPVLIFQASIVLVTAVLIIVGSLVLLSRYKPRLFAAKQRTEAVGVVLPEPQLCAHCDKPLPDGVRFCPHCGVRKV